MGFNDHDSSSESDMGDAAGRSDIVDDDNDGAESMNEEGDGLDDEEVFGDEDALDENDSDSL